jgi:hypothetical protein
LEFLFENPFLVIVLIAVISSFFRKKKDNPNTQGRTPTQAGGGQNKRLSSPIEEARDIFKEFSRSLQEQQSKPLPRKTMDKQFQSDRKMEESQKVEQPAASDVNAPETLPVRNEMTRPPIGLELEPKTAPKKELKVQEEQLIDAIIWSEILGPPRTKKPYRRNNYRS